jgi:hypothetical protein
MISLPPEPASGMNILDWAREVQKCLRRLRLTSGPGIRLTESTNSTTISADPKRGGPSINLRPLQLYQLGPNKIAVNPGTIAGAEPTIATRPLSDIDEDGLPPFLTISGASYIRANLTLIETPENEEEGEPEPSYDNLVTITAVASPALPDSTKTTTSFLIGYVGWSGANSSIASVSSWLSGSQAHVRCGYIGNYRHYFWVI